MCMYRMLVAHVQAQGQLSLIIYDNDWDYLKQGLMTNDMHHNCTVMIIINYLLTPTHDKMYVL